MSEPDAFRVQGAWRDRASLDAHERSAHVATFEAAIAQLLESRTPARADKASPAGDPGKESGAPPAVTTSRASRP